MKKIYLSICVMLFFSLSFAQVTNFERIPAKKGEKADTDVAISNNKSTPFWTEDFSSGIPGTWSNMSSAPWIYRGPSTNPNTTVGSQGAYMTNQTPIASATAQNGFLIFDSDYYDNNGIQGNFGQGMYPSPHEGLLMTGPIDLTGYIDVTLEMHSYFRTFMGQAFVNFYVNGVLVGSEQVHSGLAVNAGTTTDAVTLVRFPTTACNTSGVQMEFDFDGITQSNANGSGYYFWMIDDLALIETPSYLMDVLDANHGGWHIGYANTTGFGIDYTFKPFIQSNANPYMFELEIANIGSAPLTGIQMNVEVLDVIGSQVFLGSSDSTTLSPLDTSVYMASQSFSPSNPGIYDMRFWASSDQLPSSASSDTTYMNAVITDTIYGRDYGNAGGSWRVGRSCGGLQLGNIFDVYAQDSLTSVSAYVADYSIPGTAMYGIIYEVDTTTSPWGFIMLDQTNDHIIQVQDVDNWVNIMFSQPITLIPGPYMIAIAGYAHPTDTFGISVSGTAEILMSRIQDNGCNLGSQPIGYWYYITSTPMIRMNFGGSTSPPPIPTWDCVSPGNCVDPGNGMGQYPSLGACQFACGSTDINENIQDYLIYPNPSNGIITIDFADNRKHIVTIENLVGQIVYSDEYSSLSTGNINLSGYEKGIYLITISDDINSNTEKIIIE